MDPQTAMMLAALQQNQNMGVGVAPGAPLAGGAAQQNMMQGQMGQLPMNPLANGQNAALGNSTGASLGTPQDAAIAAMMQAPPMGAAY
jgi:hypothetical protein